MNTERRNRKQTRILMINPAIPTTFCSFQYALPFTGDKSEMLMPSQKSLIRQMEDIFEKKLYKLLQKWRNIKHRLKNEMKKMYRQLNNNMQNYFDKLFSNFEIFCETIISQWKKNIHQYGNSNNTQALSSANKDLKISSGRRMVQ